MRNFSRDGATENNTIYHPHKRQAKSEKIDRMIAEELRKMEDPWNSFASSSQFYLCLESIQIDCLSMFASS